MRLMTMLKQTTPTNRPTPDPRPDSRQSFGYLLAKVLRQHADQAALKNKIVSNATIEKRNQTIRLCFAELQADGYKLPTPRSFSNRHMKHLARKWESAGLSASTIQNRISIMRVFAAWIDKPGMIGPPEMYLEDPERAKRSYLAKEDKSWSAKNVDPEKIIAEVGHDDGYAALQMLTIFAFGLRRKEGVMLKPHRADKGTYLSISDGTKGGRHRTVLIDTPFKREVLDHLKRMVPHLDGHLGNPNRRLDQNLNRLRNLMSKHGVSKAELGVTLHGLRHQYLNDRFTAIANFPSPVRGGTLTAENLPAAKEAMAICAEEAGHARTSITGAYYGPLRPAAKAEGGA